MQDAAALATRYDPDLLCEQFIDGIELTCPVLGQGAQAQSRKRPIHCLQAKHEVRCCGACLKAC